jgi:hypothetical protein
VRYRTQVNEARTRQHLQQCDNYVTAPEFIPQLQAQLADLTALRDDAAARG